MATTQLSLLGVIPQDLYTALIERLSTQAELGEAYALSESMYSRGGEGTLTDENVLRLRAVRSAGSNKVAWSMCVLQKSEPARLSPEMLQRPIIECAIEDGCHPRALASAFGFPRLAFTLHYRGVRFQRGAVVVEVYQLFETPLSPSPLDPTTHIVSVTTRCANPSRTSSGNPSSSGPSAQELKATGMAAIRETRALLQGLVDLQRVE